MANKRVKATQVLRPDQEVDSGFLDMFNPPFEFVTAGQTLRARYIGIQHYTEIKTKYPKWQSMDIVSLMEMPKDYNPFDVYVDIIWLGMKDMNDLIPDRTHLIVAINSYTWNDFTDAFRKMVGMPKLERDADGNPIVDDVVEQKLKEARERAEGNVEQ